MENYNNINIISELMKALGCEDYESIKSKYCKDNGCKCKIDPSGGADSNCCDNIDLDIKGGFQDIDPILFSIIGEILGNIFAGKLPFNVANSVANFLALVGQILETYAAQQQYQQSGPCRFFNPAYKNITNPFCQSVCEDDKNGCSNSSLYKSNEKIENIELQLEIITNSLKNLDNRLCLIENKLNNYNKKL